MPTFPLIQVHSIKGKSESRPDNILRSVCEQYFETRLLVNNIINGNTGYYLVVGDSYKSYQSINRSCKFDEIGQKCTFKHQELSC